MKNETPELRVVGCFIEFGGKFLILRRHPDKPDGNTWGLPAGKVQTGETDETAILREIQEETGHQTRGDQLEYLGDFFFPFSDLRLHFPTYRLRLDWPMVVRHKPDEHTDFRWVSAKECYSMPDLIRGFHDLLERVGYVMSNQC